MLHVTCSMHISNHLGIPQENRDTLQQSNMVCWKNVPFSSMKTSIYFGHFPCHVWLPEGTQNKIRDGSTWGFPQVVRSLNHPFYFRIFHCKPASHFGVPLMDLETPHGTHPTLGIPDIEGQGWGADAGQASVQASVVLRNGLPHRLLRWTR